MTSKLKGLRVSVIYLLGTLLAYVALIVGALTAIILFIQGTGGSILANDALPSADFIRGLPGWVRFALPAMTYLAAFLFWNVLHNTFVTFPLMRHMAITTQLHDLEGLAQISQRARDEFAEAEGFAEALDLGAAI